MINTKNQQNKSIKTLLWLGFFVFFFLTAVLLREILLPFFLAFLLAFILDPLVSLISKFKIKNFYIYRWLSVIIVYVLILGIIVFVNFKIIPQFYYEIVKIFTSLSEAANNIDENLMQDLINKLAIFFNKYNIPIEVKGQSSANSAMQNPIISIDLLGTINDLLRESLVFIKNQTSQIIIHIQDIIKDIIKFIFMSLLVLMLTAFMLIDHKNIKSSLLSFVPKEKHNYLNKILSQISLGLSGVIRGQSLICLVNAFLTFVGLLILKVKFPIVLASIAGVLSFVPIFGTIISTIPIVAVALSSSFMTGLLALLWIIAIHLLEANLLNPKIMGNAAKIHPIIIILALLCGEHYYSITGAILAVPIASIIITLLKNLRTKVVYS